MPFCKGYKPSAETTEKITKATQARVMTVEKYDSNRTTKIEVVSSVEMIEAMKAYWAKHYVSALQMKRIFCLTTSAYNKAVEAYCNHEQMQSSTQCIDYKVYEKIVELCMQKIPYKDIAQQVGFKDRFVRQSIAKLKKFYDIEAIQRPRPSPSKEHREKLSSLLVTYNKTNPKKRDKNPRWKGGVSKVAELVRKSEKYSTWRRAAMHRDAFRCLLCGDKRNLQVDHIYPFSLLMQDGNIKTLDEAYEYQPLWDLNNARTLCKNCHSNTNTYGALVWNFKKEKMNTEKYVEEKISFAELGSKINVTNLDAPAVYDMKDEGYEILSFDPETGKEVWSPLEAFVVKANAKEHYQLNTLHGTADHKVLLDGKFVRLADHPGAELVKSPIQVVDCSVGNTHTYIAEGQINHNTTTPGGLAIPYMSSVRIRLSGGSFIEVPDGSDKRTIGANIIVKIIKNKVAYPQRSCNFQIHFGKGIVEHEELFDVLRSYCDKETVISNGKKISITGTGAWKYFQVADHNTGEVLIDEKFYKTDFKDLLANPAYRPYIDDLIEAAMVIKNTDGFVPVVDENSYTEVEQQLVNQAESDAAKESKQQ